MNDRTAVANFALAVQAIPDIATVVVGRGDLPSDGRPYPRVWVQPNRFVELVLSGDNTRLRTLSINIRVTVDANIEDEPEHKLDKLTGLIQGATYRNPLGGCLPEYSIVDRGQYPLYERGSELSIELSGTVAYLIPGASPEDQTRPPAVPDSL